MKKILIIEDDISIGEIEKDYLEISDFDATLITDGTKGFHEAIYGDYDLVIVDLMLPGMDGFQICKGIREKKDIPILMVTAKTEDIDKIKGFSLGVDDYITKPFSPTELIARIKGNLNRYDQLKKSTRTMDYIEIKDLQINLSNRQVKLRGTDIELTNKEYDLLVLLANSLNKVFTKDEIFEKVWGFNSDKDIPTITVHIRKLREKIEYDPSNPEYIITVWGVGYKIKD